MIVDQLIPGDTLDFVDSPEKFRSDDGWLMHYRLVPRFTTPPQQPIPIIGVAYNDPAGSHRFQVSSDTSAGWIPGGYTWFRYAIKTTPTGFVRQTLGDGTLTVLVNPALVGAGYDGRSHARKMLDQIEAALLALNHGVRSYTVAGRTWLKEEIDKLEALRNKYRGEVADEAAAEQMAAGGPNPRVMRGRFVRH